MFNSKKKKRKKNFVDDEIVVGEVSLKSEEKMEIVKDLIQEVKQETEDKTGKSSIAVFPEMENGPLNLGVEERIQAIEDDEKIFETSVNFEEENSELIINSQDTEEEHIVNMKPLYTEDDIEEEPCEDNEEDTSPFAEASKEGTKKDMQRYFDKGMKKSKKLKKTKEKKSKKSKKQQRMEREFDEIRDQRFYLFEKKKYKKVDDFISYLNKHYKEIDQIAQKLLADEKFYEWISKRSGVFDESLEKFKEIKEKIEN